MSSKKGKKPRSKDLRSWSDLRSSVPLFLNAPARTTPLMLRPFGYLALSLIWTVLLFLIVGSTVVLMPALISDEIDGGLQQAGMFDKSDWPVGLVVIFLFGAPILGVATVGLTLAGLGIVSASWLAFFRSLNPAYADEKLTFSTFTMGESLGAVPGVTLSVLPHRLTRVSKIVMMIYFAGWVPNGVTAILGVVYGVGYFWTVGWLLWPAQGLGAVLCRIVSLLVIIALGWLLWRRRASFLEVMPEAFKSTMYANSWPHKPIR